MINTEQKAWFLNWDEQRWNWIPELNDSDKTLRKPYANPSLLKALIIIPVMLGRGIWESYYMSFQMKAMNFAFVQSDNITGNTRQICIFGIYIQPSYELHIEPCFTAVKLFTFHLFGRMHHLRIVYPFITTCVYLQRYSLISPRKCGGM